MGAPELSAPIPGSFNNLPGAGNPYIQDGAVAKAEISCRDFGIPYTQDTSEIAVFLNSSYLETQIFGVWRGNASRPLNVAIQNLTC